MISSIGKAADRFFAFTLHLVEQSTLPLAEKEASPLKKNVLYTLQFFKGVLSLCLLSFSAPIKLFRYLMISIATQSEQPLKSMTNNPCVFPKDFSFGIADSFFQSCGLGYSPADKEQISDWSQWMNSHFPDNTPHIAGNPNYATFFIDYLEHPDRIIHKLIEIGATEYRFSLERCVLEPKEGEFDAICIKKYQAFLEKLKKNNIRPLLTLHHFVNPVWFMDKGGFENSETIAGFVRYSEKMFEAFSHLVTDWVTLNELAICPFQGYVRGVYPPGVTDLRRFGEVLKNQLVAHCKAYEIGKRRHPNLKIGFSHNWLIFRPYSKHNPVERIVSHYLSEITHRAVIRFFKTGIFSLQIPFSVNMQHHEPKAPNSFDFVGVQNYVRPAIEIGFSGARSGLYPGEKMTNTGSRFSPQNLKGVLKEASTFGKEIYITEFGSDISQTEYFNTVFPIVAKAIVDGAHIKKAFIWTLRQNFEWDFGARADFGLCDSAFKNRPVIEEAIQSLFLRQRQQKELITSEF